MALGRKELTDRALSPYRHGHCKPLFKVLEGLAVLKAEGMMNEDGVNDTQMTWIYEFNDDGIYGLHSHALGRRELVPMDCENPGICFQRKQMIKHGPD